MAEFLRITKGPDFANQYLELMTAANTAAVSIVSSTR